MISVSIVLYNPVYTELAKTIQCVLSSSIVQLLYLIDNSPADSARAWFTDDRIKYIKTNKNIGFGSGHNIALREAINLFEYHLVLNPDVTFEPETLENILKFVTGQTEIGLVMPKVLYPDGQIQYLCKLLPTPADLFVRRFIPFKNYQNKKNHIFEIRASGYDKIMNVPYLSGCFMFLSTSALRQVGMFDERYFLYGEDVDLSRRIHKHYRTLYYPNVYIYHDHARASYKHLKMTLIHVANAMRYFNKWGWLIDEERTWFNTRVLKSITGTIDS
jgi:hypothetical protein